MKMKKSISFLFAVMLSFVTMAQDNCASALDIVPGTYVVDQVNGNEPPTIICAGANLAAYGEWYRYTPDNDYYITVSSNVVNVTPVDTRLHIYTGSCGALQCAGGDDDSGPGYSSIASMNVEAGVTYYFAWDSYWTADGFSFTLSVAPPVVNLLDFVPVAATVSAQAVMDMNGDYLDDMVAYDGNNGLQIAYQQPNGTFDTQTRPIADDVSHSPSWSMCGGDLDGNGFNDLLFAGGSGASFIWADPTGTSYNEVSDENYIFCQRSNMVDMNADGQLDAFVCHDVAPNVWYMNNGTQFFDWNQGGMGDTPDGGNYGSVWIDYDNDCDIDLFIAKCRGGDSPANINQMHRNNGDGTYTEVGAEIGLADNVQTWSSAWADYDNDGDMDVVVGASSFANGGHKVMINDGIGFFTDQTAGSGFDVNPNLSIEWAPGDFNNDGWVDVMGGGQILINNGNLTFTPTQVAFSAGPIGDLNDDGFLDVVAGGTRFMNTPNGNHFISLNMLGTESNRNGIGARVTLYTPSGEQIRDVRSGEGFRYMSSLNVHFGIGMDEQINKITICWPSGITDEILNPQIDQTLLIVEGQNEVSMDETNASFVQLLPNPAQHQIAVLGAQFIRSVKAYDVSGRQVALPAMQGTAYSVEHLLPGMYFIQVETGNGVESLPFIKE
jgi:hypothetical protein